MRCLELNKKTFICLLTSLKGSLSEKHIQDIFSLFIIWSLADIKWVLYPGWEPMSFRCQLVRKIFAPAFHRFYIISRFFWVAIHKYSFHKQCTRRTSHHFFSGPLAEKLGLSLSCYCWRRPHDDKVFVVFYFCTSKFSQFISSPKYIKIRKYKICIHFFTILIQRGRRVHIQPTRSRPSSRSHIQVFKKITMSLYKIWCIESALHRILIFSIVLVILQVDWDGVKLCLVAIFVFITFKFWMFIVHVQGLALLDRTRLIWGSNLCNVLHNHEVLTLILFVFVFVNQQVSALDLQELLQWCYVTINLQRFSFFPAPALNWWPVTGHSSHF